MTQTINRYAFVALTCALFAPAAMAISLGSANNFDTPGDVEGWSVAVFGVGHPFPPEIIVGGGPGGAGDNYLQLESDPTAGPPGPVTPGRSMTAFNALPTWTGDYTAAGVTKITMVANNFGPDTLHLRLLFGDFNAGFSGFDNIGISTDAVVLAPGSGWTPIVFDVDASDLTAPIGTAAAALASTETLRIFHNTVASHGGPGVGIPAVTAVLGLDNISAVPVPPALALLVPAIAVLSGRRRAIR